MKFSIIRTLHDHVLCTPFDIGISLLLQFWPQGYLVSPTNVAYQRLTLNIFLGLTEASTDIMANIYILLEIFSVYAAWVVNIKNVGYLADISYKARRILDFLEKFWNLILTRTWRSSFELERHFSWNPGIAKKLIVQTLELLLQFIHFTDFLKNGWNVWGNAPL